MSGQGGRALYAAALAFALFALLTPGRWPDLVNAPGIDFYQLWGVAQAQRASGHHLGSPYLEEEGYQQQLEAIAAESQDRTLAAAMSFRSSVDMTATPLMYELFGALPRDYTAALWMFRSISIAAFFLSAVALALRLGVGILPALLFVTALMLVLDPLAIDMWVGNVGALQFLLVVSAAIAIERTSGHPSIVVPASIFLLLAMIVLTKPSMLFPALALAVSAWLNASGTGRFAAALLAFAGSAVLWLLPCLAFGSTGIWADWWHATFPSIGRMAYDRFSGNHASALYVSAHTGLALGACSAALMSVMAISAAGAIAARGVSNPRVLAFALREVALDPYRALVIGLLVFFATSPLVWLHYFALTVVPLLWCCTRARAGSWACGVLSLAMLCGFARVADHQASWFLPVYMACVSWCWLPLWLATLADLRQIGRRASDCGVTSGPG